MAHHDGIDIGQLEQTRRILGRQIDAPMRTKALLVPVSAKFILPFSIMETDVIATPGHPVLHLGLVFRTPGRIRLANQRRRAFLVVDGIDTLRGVMLAIRRTRDEIGLPQHLALVVVVDSMLRIEVYVDVRLPIALAGAIVHRRFLLHRHFDRGRAARADSVMQRLVDRQPIGLPSVGAAFDRALDAVFAGPGAFRAHRSALVHELLHPIVHLVLVKRQLHVLVGKHPRRRRRSVERAHIASVRGEGDVGLQHLLRLFQRRLQPLIILEDRRKHIVVLAELQHRLHRGERLGDMCDDLLFIKGRAALLGRDAERLRIGIVCDRRIPRRNGILVVPVHRIRNLLAEAIGIRRGNHDVGVVVRQEQIEGPKEPGIGVHRLAREVFGIERQPRFRTHDGEGFAVLPLNLQRIAVDGFRQRAGGLRHIHAAHLHLPDGGYRVVVEREEHRHDQIHRDGGGNDEGLLAQRAVFRTQRSCRTAPKIGRAPRQARRQVLRLACRLGLLEVFQQCGAGLTGLCRRTPQCIGGVLHRRRFLGDDVGIHWGGIDRVLVRVERGHPPGFLARRVIRNRGTGAHRPPLRGNLVLSGEHVVIGHEHLRRHLPARAGAVFRGHRPARLTHTPFLDLCRRIPVETTARGRTRRAPPSGRTRRAKPHLGLARLGIGLHRARIFRFPRLNGIRIVYAIHSGGGYPCHRFG